MMDSALFDKIDGALTLFRKRKIDQIHKFDQFNLIAIAHHSSGIEGSTLTLIESTNLIEHGTTASGKPLYEHNMVLDHYEALLKTVELADFLIKEKGRLTVEHIQQINSAVLKRTGGFVNSPLGRVDLTKGEFRNGSVRAGDTAFMAHNKVEGEVKKLIALVNENLNSVKTTRDQLSLSFQAHYNLVSIHPFFDGNGRTSRLLGNLLQRYHGLPLGLVHQDNKNAYIEALKESRAKHNPAPIVDFLVKEYLEHLTREIALDKNKGKGFGVSFIL